MVGFSSSPSSLWEEESKDADSGGTDELLAILGYKVQASDMEDETLILTTIT